MQLLLSFSYLHHPAGLRTQTGSDHFVKILMDVSSASHSTFPVSISMRSPWAWEEPGRHFRREEPRGSPPAVVLGLALLQLSFVCKNSRNIEHMLNSGPHACVCDKHKIISYNYFNNFNNSTDNISINKIHFLYLILPAPWC